MLGVDSAPRTQQARVGSHVNSHLCFHPKVYTPLENLFLASQQKVTWSDVEKLLKSDLILVLSSLHPPKDGISISSGLLHIIADLAQQHLLSQTTLSAYILREGGECDILIEAETRFATHDQAVFEAMKPHLNRLCELFTDADKQKICKRVEEAFRRCLLERIFGKSSVNKEFDTTIVDHEPRWLAVWKKSQSSSISELIVGTLPEHTPDQPSEYYQLGHVSLEKRRETPVAAIALKIEKSAMEEYIANARNPTQQVAAIRKGHIEKVLLQILQIVKEKL